MLYPGLAGICWPHVHLAELDQLLALRADLVLWL